MARSVVAAAADLDLDPDPASKHGLYLCARYTSSSSFATVAGSVLRAIVAVEERPDLSRINEVCSTRQIVRVKIRE